MNGRDEERPRDIVAHWRGQGAVRGARYRREAVAVAITGGGGYGASDQRVATARYSLLLERSTMLRVARAAGGRRARRPSRRLRSRRKKTRRPACADRYDCSFSAAWSYM